MRAKPTMHDSSVKRQSNTVAKRQFIIIPMQVQLRGAHDIDPVTK